MERKIGDRKTLKRTNPTTTIATVAPISLNAVRVPATT